MKNKFNLGFLLIAFALISSFIGCSKDELSPSMQNLTSKTWMFDTILAPDADEFTQALLPIASIFYTDATMKFSDNDKFVMVMLGQSLDGTYSLSSDEKSITLNNSDTYTIVELSASKFTYKETIVDSLQTYEMLYYWK